MTELLKVEGLVKSYGEFTLDHLDLTVPEGCVTGFVGSNGAGKTTAIKSILGVVLPDAGTIELFGERTDSGEAAIARAKERIGVVFDTCPFLSESRVSDVASIGRFAWKTWDRLSFETYLRTFGLDPKKRVRDLSRGMGMKLQLAFALAHKSDLLILDEATAGLDPMARDEVLDILRAYMADGAHGILMSSHITTDLEKIADHVVCIDGGRTVFSCSTDEICDIAGIARCRSAEVEAIAGAGLFEPGSLRVMRDAYSISVLVPDRAVLRRRFPEVACERASIEEYMAFMLKGESR